MQNPLEHEEAAFRVVLYAVAYFAPIVVASWIATWLGFVVFLAATATVVVLVRRSSRSSPPDARTETADAPAVPDTRRVVVLASEALPEPRLHDVLETLGGDDIVLVCPVPVAATEEDEASAAARLEEALEALRRRGMRARGTVERGDPLACLGRAVGPYGADEVVVATVTGAAAGSGLDGAAAAAVRTAFDGPVTHVAY